MTMQTNGQVYIYNPESTEIYLGCINRMKIMHENSLNGFVVQADEAIIYKEYDDWIVAPNYYVSKSYLMLYLISDSSGDTLTSYKLKCREIPKPTFYWGNREEKSNGFLFNVSFHAFLPSWFPFSYKVNITNIYITIHNKKYEAKGDRLSPELIAILRNVPKGETVTFDFQYSINEGYFSHQTYWTIN